MVPVSVLKRPTGAPAAAAADGATASAAAAAGGDAAASASTSATSAAMRRGNGGRKGDTTDTTSGAVRVGIAASGVGIGGSGGGGGSCTGVVSKSAIGLPNLAQMGTAAVTGRKWITATALFSDMGIGGGEFVPPSVAALPV